MRTDAVAVEEGRLEGLESIEEYRWFKERHRVFPAVFEGRKHERIIDLSAGVGCAAARVRDNYSPGIVCNDIAPTCLKMLDQAGLATMSFDLDDPATPFPIMDGAFDCAISLVTIEHITHIDHFLAEVRRILSEDGYLYISAPNYAAPEYSLKLALSGRSFHDPLGKTEDAYEFFAHIRYFTYLTLLEYVSSFGFAAEAVYIARPGGSTRYRALYNRSPFMALSFRTLMTMRHRMLSPRWASEPILCFRKGAPDCVAPRKVVL